MYERTNELEIETKMKSFQTEMRRNHRINEKNAVTGGSKECNDDIELDSLRFASISSWWFEILERHSVGMIGRLA
jgi:hypothetical protein